MKNGFQLTQPQRLAALVIDLSIVVTACWFLFDSFYPPLGEKGFWGYSALLAVLVGSKLITPFYVKPADAISYSVPAFISLMLVNEWSRWSVNQMWGFSVAAGYSVLIFSLGITNIISNAFRGDWAGGLSNRTRISLEYLGLPQFVYTPVLLFALFSYHLDSGLEVAIICMVVGTTVWWSFGSFLIGFGIRIGTSFFTKNKNEVVAEIIAFQEPKIVLLKQKFEGDIVKGDLLFINDEHGPLKLVVALDCVGRLDGILVRTIELKSVSNEYKKLVGGMPLKNVAYKISGDELTAVCERENIDANVQSTIAGLVSQDTSIQRLYFEVVDNNELEEGRLVSGNVGIDRVYYQIVSGLTREDIVRQKDTYGYVRAQAQQIGVWNEGSSKFHQCSWLPQINSLVHLESKESYQIDIDSIGHFPKSNFKASVKSIDELVTHNTAILGILGVGKSMLAIELVERMIAHGIKVVCLDLTNQYEKELGDFYDTNHEQACLNKIQAASELDREVFEDDPEKGGSLPNLSHAIYRDLADFLGVSNTRKLKIYNPSSFIATKQKQEPKSYNEDGAWHRTAGLFSVTPVEITQIISEAVLNILSDKMSEKARVCLVYEEAHSLVPEWNSVVNEGDKNATSGTARAILQGRKYGLGCLLITQRRANVTKTILNQCNTVFAMRTFDETGKKFLANYIGDDYSSALSSMQERHAVFFGKASSCENPVLLRLNDQDKFRSIFRETYSPPALPVLTHSDQSIPTEDELNDDIPF